MTTTAFRMKPLYDVLLCGSPARRMGLYHLYKATPEQLCRLHYSPGSIKAIQARLKTLTDHGYIQANAVAVPHHGIDRTFFSARYFYTLAPAGVKYLAGLGFDVDAGWRPHSELDKHGLYVAHTLELNDVLIAAALLSDVDARVALAQFTHEVVLKRRPIAVTLPDRKASAVIPDAYLEFRQVGTTVQFPVLLEHDRGTEERAHFKRKIEAYVVFVKARGYEAAFGSKSINIVFTTFQGDDRREELRSWTQQALDHLGEPRPVYRAFRFAALPQPPSPETAWLEPHWYAPTDDPPTPLFTIGRSAS